jgi:hypothetical protein
MNFKKNKYTVIKKAISKDFALFLYNYFLIKRQVAKTLFDTKFISPFETMFGVWTDEQVPGTYSHYADIAMETLLLKLQPVMEKQTGLKLIPNYSYARIYKNGDILKRHKDRFSCEISTTLNLGGEPWPIYVDPTGSDNVIDEYKNVMKPNAPKGVKVDLKPGDMLVYRGNLLEHWREPFQGQDCAQVFLHYTNIKTPDSEKHIYDKRPHIGLPSDFVIKS